MDFDRLMGMQLELMDKIPHKHEIKDMHQGLVVAGFGVIEEVLEYLNTIGFKSWRPLPLTEEEQLEELTDILFFYLEMIILSGFTPDQVERQYHIKHGVNLERYRKAKEGDYGWDKRSEKEGL